MADFSNLKAMEVTGETTKEYVFGAIVGEPSLIVAPATDANKDYLDLRLRLSLEESEQRAAAPRGKVSTKLTPEQIAKQLEDEREFDRKLLSRACVKGWGTAPVDAKGKPVEFTPENAYDFLVAIPDYLLDPFRNFAGNIYNFMPTLEAPDGNALGNS